MDAKTYQGITFAADYDKTFAGFKKDFENTHVFKKVPSASREAELAKAYKIATGKDAVEVTQPANSKPSK